MASKVLILLAILGVSIPIAIAVLAPKDVSLESVATMTNEERIEIKRDERTGFITDVTVHRQVNEG